VHKLRGLTLHYLIRAFVLLGFSFYIVYLVKLNKLQLYIAPRIIPYVKFTSLGLFFLAAYFVYLAIQHAFEEDSAGQCDHACDCNHEPPQSTPKTIALYGLFLFPLLLGVVLPDKMMGSDMAAIKGMNLTVANTLQPSTNRSQLDNEAALPVPEMSTGLEEEQKVGDPAALTPVDSTRGEANVTGEQSAIGEQPAIDQDPLDKLFPSDEYTLDYATLGKHFYKQDTIHVKEEGFLETISILDLYKNNFVGKTIVISGFVYREADMQANQFIVSRLAMQCCSADSMPYGFVVKSSSKEGLEKDAWVTVTGTLGLIDYRGNTIIELDAQSIQAIKAPSDPYVYPFYDDYEKLITE